MYINPKMSFLQERLELLLRYTNPSGRDRRRLLGLFTPRGGVVGVGEKSPPTTKPAIAVPLPGMAERNLDLLWRIIIILDSGVQ